MASRPAIVVFDLGGVIVEILRSPQEALAAAGMSDAGSVVITDRESYDTLNAAYQSGHLSLDEFLSRTSGLMEPSVEPAFLVNAHDQILVREYPGAVEVIDSLHAMDIATCVLSNTCARHWTRLELFPAVKKATRNGCFLSFELGCVKPQTSIFQALENELGLTGQDICFLDDSAENVAASLSFGWQAVQVSHARKDSAALKEDLQGFGFTL